MYNYQDIYHPIIQVFPYHLFIFSFECDLFLHKEGVGRNRIRATLTKHHPPQELGSMFYYPLDIRALRQASPNYND